MSDPVADFLAREQNVLFGIENGAADVAVENAAPDINGDDLDYFDANLSRGGDSGIDLSKLDTQPRPLQNTGSTPSPLTIGGGTPRIEPEKIRKWRENQKAMLEEKGFIDLEENKKKEDLRQAAQKELNDWYVQRAEKLAKMKSLNRKAEEELLAERDSIKEGAEWERIVKLCEFNAKNSKSTTDLSRFRSLLIELKTRKM